MTAVYEKRFDLTLAGGPIRVYESGPGDGPPVVLLHGAGVDCAELIWRNVVSGLAQDNRVIAIDLPRHGASAPWRVPVDQEKLEQVVLALLDQLQIDRAALIGLSMGGAVALGFALSHPRRTSRVVLVAPGGFTLQQPLHAMSWGAIRVPFLMWGVTNLMASWPLATRMSWASNLPAGERTPGFDGIVDEAVAEAKRRRQRVEPATDDWSLFSYGPMRCKLKFAVEEMEVPSLWLFGEDDPLVSRVSMRGAVKRTPGSVLHEFSGAGHMLPLDHPGEFVGVVRPFLAGEVAPGDTAIRREWR